MQPLRRLVAAAPFGQAVANQNADVIKTASAERIPIRAAGTGSDHKRPVVAGSGSWSPRSKAAIKSKSRVRANLMSRSSAARTSAVNGVIVGRRMACFKILDGTRNALHIQLRSVRWLATASAVAQSSTAP